MNSHRMNAAQMNALHELAPRPPGPPCPVKAAKQADLSTQHDALAAALAARAKGDEK